MSRFVIMDPRALVPHPLNDEVFGTDGVNEDFIDDVKVHGVQTVIEAMPLRTTSDGEKLPADRHVIIKGHRRVLAAIHAGQEEVPVLVRDPSDPKDAELELLRDNLPKLRRDLTPEILARMVKAIEKRQVRKKVVGRPKRAIAEVASRTGLSERTVRDAMAVESKVEALKAEGNHEQAATLVEMAQASLRKAAEASREVIPALPDPKAKVRMQSDDEVEESVRERRAALVRAERSMAEIAKALRNAATADGGVEEHPDLREALHHWQGLSAAIADWLTR